MRLMIAIAFCLMSADIFIRVVSPQLSGNIAHIQKFPAISQELSEQQSATDNTILFLGNSLTGNAINLDQFKSELSKARGAHTSAYKVVPDGTSFWDWYCIAKNSFLDAHAAPQTLIVGFAWTVEKPDPSRLATHFCGVTDLPDLIQLGMNSTSEIVEFLLASVSKLYALRETVHKRLLDKLIPHYRQYTQAANAANQNKDKRDRKQSAPAGNYAIISQLVRMLNENNIETIFIAMPVITRYSLDLKLISLMQAENTVLYDYRKLEGIRKEMFMDPIHLNKRGSEVFTRKLARDLSHRREP